MDAAFFALLGVALTALIGVAVAFEKVTKGDRSDAVIGLSDAGELWIFARRAREGWHRSALGRALLTLAICSGIMAVLIHRFID